MTEAEFTLWRDLRAEVLRLHGSVDSLTASVSGCQAAAAARRAISKLRPSWLNAVAAWAALALTLTLELLK